MPSEIQKLERAKNAAFLDFKAEKDFHKAQKLHRKFVRIFNRWRAASECPTHRKT